MSDVINGQYTRFDPIVDASVNEDSYKCGTNHPYALTNSEVLSKDMNRLSIESCEDRNWLSPIPEHPSFAQNNSMVSNTSIASSVDSVPFELSALSSTKGTPPPKMTFRKRRSQAEVRRLSGTSDIEEELVETDTKSSQTDFAFVDLEAGRGFTPQNVPLMPSPLPPVLCSTPNIIVNEDIEVQNAPESMNLVKDVHEEDRGWYSVLVGSHLRKTGERSVQAAYRGSYINTNIHPELSVAKTYQNPLAQPHKEPPKHEQNRLVSFSSKDTYIKMKNVSSPLPSTTVSEMLPSPPEDRILHGYASLRQLDGKRITDSVKLSKKRLSEPLRSPMYDDEIVRDLTLDEDQKIEEVTRSDTPSPRYQNPVSKSPKMGTKILLLSPQRESPTQFEKKVQDACELGDDAEVSENDPKFALQRALKKSCSLPRYDLTTKMSMTKPTTSSLRKDTRLDTSSLDGKVSKTLWSTLKSKFSSSKINKEMEKVKVTESEIVNQQCSVIDVDSTQRAYNVIPEVKYGLTYLGTLKKYGRLPQDIKNLAHKYDLFGESATYKSVFSSKYLDTIQEKQKMSEEMNKAGTVSQEETSPEKRSLVERMVEKLSPQRKYKTSKASRRSCPPAPDLSLVKHDQGQNERAEVIKKWAVPKIQVPMPTVKPSSFRIHYKTAVNRSSKDDLDDSVLMSMMEKELGASNDNTTIKEQPCTDLKMEPASVKDNDSVLMGSQDDGASTITQSKPSDKPARDSSLFTAVKDIQVYSVSTNSLPAVNLTAEQSVLSTMFANDDTLDAESVGSDDDLDDAGIDAVQVTDVEIQVLEDQTVSKSSFQNEHLQPQDSILSSMIGDMDSFNSETAGENDITLESTQPYDVTEVKQLSEIPSMPQSVTDIKVQESILSSMFGDLESDSDASYDACETTHRKGFVIPTIVIDPPEEDLKLQDSVLSAIFGHFGSEQSIEYESTSLSNRTDNHLTLPDRNSENEYPDRKELNVDLKDDMCKAVDNEDVCISQTDSILASIYDKSDTFISEAESSVMASGHAAELETIVQETEIKPAEHSTLAGNDPEKGSEIKCSPVKSYLNDSIISAGSVHTFFNHGDSIEEKEPEMHNENPTQHTGAFSALMQDETLSDQRYLLPLMKENEADSTCGSEAFSVTDNSLLAMLPDGSSRDQHTNIKHHFKDSSNQRSLECLFDTVWQGTATSVCDEAVASPYCEWTDGGVSSAPSSSMRHNHDPVSCDQVILSVAEDSSMMDSVKHKLSIDACDFIACDPHQEEHAGSGQDVGGHCEWDSTVRRDVDGGNNVAEQSALSDEYDLESEDKENQNPLTHERGSGTEVDRSPSFLLASYANPIRHAALHSGGDGVTSNQVLTESCVREYFDEAYDVEETDSEDGACDVRRGMMPDMSPIRGHMKVMTPDQSPIRGHKEDSSPQSERFEVTPEDSPCRYKHDSSPENDPSHLETTPEHSICSRSYRGVTRVNVSTPEQTPMACTRPREESTPERSPSPDCAQERLYFDSVREKIDKKANTILDSFKQQYSSVVSRGNHDNGALRGGDESMNTPVNSPADAPSHPPHHCDIQQSPAAATYTPDTCPHNIQDGVKDDMICMIQGCDCPYRNSNGNNNNVAMVMSALDLDARDVSWQQERDEDRITSVSVEELLLNTSENVLSFYSLTAPDSLSSSAIYSPKSAHLPNSSTDDLPNSSTDDLPNSSTDDLPNSSLVDLPNSSSVDLPNSSLIANPGDLSDSSLINSTEDLPTSSHLYSPAVLDLDSPNSTHMSSIPDPDEDLPSSSFSTGLVKDFSENSAWEMNL